MTSSPDVCSHKGNIQLENGNGVCSHCQEVFIIPQENTDLISLQRKLKELIRPDTYVSLSVEVDHDANITYKAYTEKYSWTTASTQKHLYHRVLGIPEEAVIMSPIHEVRNDS